VKKFALIVMIVAAFAVPANAVASNGYNNVAGVNQNDGSSGGPSSPVAEASVGDTGSSTLPFTGLQLALMFGAGVALLGTGVALRRAHTR